MAFPYVQTLSSAPPSGAINLNSNMPTTGPGSLQSAIDNAADGSTFVFTGGVYELTGTLNIRNINNATFRPASGAQVYISGSTVDSDGNSTGSYKSQVVNIANTCNGISFLNLCVMYGDTGLYVGSSNAYIEKCTFTRCITSGVSFNACLNPVLTDCYCTNCQDRNANMNNCTNVLVQRNRFLDSKGTAGYDGSQGGFKTSRCRGGMVKHNIAENNVGHGLWVDIHSKVDLVRNACFNNTRAGIFYEISGVDSPHSLLMDNLLVGNETYGIHAGNSRGLDIYHNTMDGNALDLNIAQSTRNYDTNEINQNQSGSSLGQNGNYEMDDIVVRSNIFANATGGSPVGKNVLTSYWINNSEGVDYRSNPFIVACDYNSYYQTAPFVTTEIMYYRPYSNGVTTGDQLYANIAEIKSKTTFEDNALEAKPASSLPFVNPGARNYALNGTSASNNSGYPLPAHIASKVGLTAGTQYDRGVVEFCSIL